jgi:hypothetical protein
MRRIVLHVDRLVLRSFRYEDRDAIADGLQVELARLFAEPDTAARLMNIDNTAHLQVGNVSVRHGEKPTSVGVQAAQGIARSIKS